MAATPRSNVLTSLAHALKSHCFLPLHHYRTHRTHTEAIEPMAANDGILFFGIMGEAELRQWVDGQRFDTALCLETLEHVPPDLLEPYVEEIAKATTGYFVVTVPNEKGPVFLAKYVVKRLFGDYFHYRPIEVWGAFIGRMGLRLNLRMEINCGILMAKFIELTVLPLNGLVELNNGIATENVIEKMAPLLNGRMGSNFGTSMAKN